MRKIIMAILASIALAIGGLSLAAPASATADACRNTLFPDSNLMDRICFDVVDDAGGSWHVTTTVVYNITVAEGGHTDSVGQICFFDSDCYDPGSSASEGGTKTITTDKYQSDSNTIWICVRNDYGAATYYKNIYVNKSKGTSATNESSCT